IRVSTYRNSSLALVKYVHYQATIPDRNSTPSRSGNYLLKVFLNNDTAQIAFTKRFVVVNTMTQIASQIQQPFNGALFRTGQRVHLGVQTDKRINALSPSDLKVAVLQNQNWQTAVFLDRPTIFRGNYFEYSDEAITGMVGLKEFRWLDLRSLRLRSDRMQDLNNKADTVQVYVKPETTRNGQAYVYFRDLNGGYTIETYESINPFWQSDYSLTHFKYFPPNNRALSGNDVYIFGEMTNYGTDTSGLMHFNAESGAYEKTLLLKQGYYNYLYGTRPFRGGPLEFSQTEGNYWATENNYIVLVYYRPFGGRADECIGFSSLNSVFQRPGQ
ncbi:MAG TPA: type IX secretion system plug protein domain-containing protein, partial [Flavisolibacter sp.]|nr:type IX secretion system plug protein domain-containing protein [Flavisolibacter sp.]